MSSKSVSEILKILLQTIDINIFILSRHVQLKNSLTKKTSAAKYETHFSREAIEN